MYDDVILIVDEPKGSCSVEELEFKFVSFWIHFHNLPRVCFCRKYVVALVNSIGSFEAAKVDENDKLEGETLRVKVKINCKEPLKRGTNVKIGFMAEKTWIPITYEKLLDFCYCCGKLGHVIQECDVEGVENSKEKMFGVELRETRASKAIYKGWRTENREHFDRGRGRGRTRRFQRGGRNHQHNWNGDTQKG